jgi:hypothetical protein
MEQSKPSFSKSERKRGIAREDQTRERWKPSRANTKLCSSVSSTGTCVLIWVPVGFGRSTPWS